MSIFLTNFQIFKNGTSLSIKIFMVHARHSSAPSTFPCPTKEIGKVQCDYGRQGGQSDIDPEVQVNCVQVIFFQI